MAAFGAGANRPLPGRGPSPGFRFTIYALLSLVAMYYDQRGGVLERVRYWMQAAAYPIQLAVSSPSAAWHWFEESVETRESLRAIQLADPKLGQSVQAPPTHPAR